MNFDTQNLGVLASRTKYLRQAGVAMLLGSALLGIFFFVPLTSRDEIVVGVEEPTPPPNPYDGAVLSAGAAIVYDLVTGETLYEKNADAQLPLASLSKLLAVEAAIRALPLDLPITVTKEDTSVDSPKRFSPGDTLTLRDMARLTLTASLNDGAAAIVKAIAVRQATTTPRALQNAAAALGLASTYAVNGNGLDISDVVAGGYGSARDVARLAGALVNDAPEIALATTMSKIGASTLSGRHYEILNTNPTVTYIPRLLLSKTGFTELAGGNLVLVFDASINHPIAVVVLRSTEESRFTDASSLVAATFAYFSGTAPL